MRIERTKDIYIYIERERERNVGGEEGERKIEFFKGLHRVLGILFLHVPIGDIQSFLQTLNNHIRFKKKRCLAFFESLLEW